MKLKLKNRKDADRLSGPAYDILVLQPNGIFLSGLKRAKGLGASPKSLKPRMVPEVVSTGLQYYGIEDGNVPFASGKHGQTKAAAG